MKLTRLGLQCQTPLRSYPLSLIPFPFSFTLFPLSLISYPLSLPLVPYPLVLALSRNLGKGSCHCYCNGCCCHPKSTPGPRPKTRINKNPLDHLWNKFQISSWVFNVKYQRYSNIYQRSGINYQMWILICWVLDTEYQISSITYQVSDIK